MLLVEKDFVIAFDDPCDYWRGGVGKSVNTNDYYWISNDRQKFNGRGEGHFENFCVVSKVTKKVSEDSHKTLETSPELSSDSKSKL